MRGILKYAVLKISLYLHSQIEGSHKGINSLRSNSFKQVQDKQGEYGQWSTVISHLSLQDFT